MESPPLSLDFIRQVVAEYFADKPVRRGQVLGSYARPPIEPDLTTVYKQAAHHGHAQLRST